MVKTIGFGRVLLFGISLTGLVLIGCVSGAKPDARPETTRYIYCEDPRPEICTQEYLPVCGRLANGDQKNYGNACTACSDKDVLKYKLDACP